MKDKRIRQIVDEMLGIEYNALSLGNTEKETAKRQIRRGSKRQEAKRYIRRKTIRQGSRV